MSYPRVVTLVMVSVVAIAAGFADAIPSDALKAPFSWTLGKPVLSARTGEPDTYYSVKDPSVVYYGGAWHVFCTVRGKQRSHQIEYITFDKWENTSKAKRTFLKCREGYFCAPEVFYFRPHKKWYMIYQVNEKDRKIGMQPAYSTTDNIADPNSWSQAKLLFPKATPDGVYSWIDFWVICDDERAYLFFTSNDGNLWRMWTPIDKFPNGFDHLERALQAGIYEAGHVYRLKDEQKYLALIEEQGGAGWRYYKAYTADRLDGGWTPLADTYEKPFAGLANVRQPDPVWAEAISHGELIRDGYDETLTVDPNNLQFLIQGVTNAARAGRSYGEIPWKLGLLTPADH
jgi:hypothetical protein